MDKIIYEEYYNRMLEYMAKYGSYYDEKTKKTILSEFLKYDNIIEHSSDALNEVYQVTGVFDHVPNNTYARFLKELKKRFDINQRLLEVGCGYYPAFAEKLAKEQKQGFVDAIDPKVVTTDVPGVNVRKEELNAGYDVSNYDLIYGIQPCTASFDMIRVANLNDKDLCFLVCGCGATLMGKMPMNMWLKFAEQMIKQTLPKTREYKIEYVKTFKQPLIYTRKLKK